MLSYPSMTRICLHVCIWGRLSASLLTWRPQFPAGHCSLILPGWVSSGPVSSLLGTNRYYSFFHTRYQPLWIDMAPEIPTFTCQNLNKLKEGRIGLYRQRHSSLLCSLWCKEWLGFIIIQSNLPEFVAWMNSHGKGENEKQRSSLHIMLWVTSSF